MVESIDLPSLKRNNVEYWKRKQSKNVVDKNIKKNPHNILSFKHPNGARETDES